MNRQLLDLLLKWPRAFISGTDLSAHLGPNANARHAIIKRAVAEGFLQPLRRDLYLIGKVKHPPIDVFELAPIIYGPSYISFESALSFHGWIPEAVRSVTCASAKRAAEFETILGAFTYARIPIEAFSLGVEQLPAQSGATLFIATPEKALADFVYARRRTWDTMEDLAADLRIDIGLIRSVDCSLVSDLLAHYPGRRVRLFLGYLKEEAKVWQSL